MAAFADTAGRRWTVSITIDSVRRVRDRLDVDLLSAKLPELLERLFGDQVLLCDVLWVIVEREALAAGVTDEEFGRSMAGDALEEGAKAFLEALRDFTPNPRDRARVGALLSTILEAAEAIRDQAEQALQKETERLRAAVNSGELFSTSPDRPASSPGDSPSGS